MTRYQGGKNGSGVFQTIINAIPWHWRYVEAFAGSAAIYRHKLPAAGGSILVERSEDQAARLRSTSPPGTTVLQGDALKLLAQPFDWHHTDFVYLDPPYHHQARRDLALYEHELSDDAHGQLLHSLLPAMSDRGVKWALSGYRCAAYDDASSRYGWHRMDYPAMTRRGVVTESLWTNYDPATVHRLHDYRYLGRDFRERERIARKVRRWVGKLQLLPLREREAIMEALANTARVADAAAATAGPGERIPSASTIATPAGARRRRHLVTSLDLARGSHHG
jgi:DNA adenine methylase